MLAETLARIEARPTGGDPEPRTFPHTAKKFAPWRVLVVDDEPSAAALFTLANPSGGADVVG
jgi:hypothetical protein